MLKKGLAILCLCGLSNLAKAQLTIYPGLKKTGTSQICQASGPFTGATIPGGLDNGINSIVLTQGYMATLAENEDGTGESFCYVAAVSDVDVDLSVELQSKVSFIRVLPTGAIKKKGVCGKDNAVVAALKPSWFYDWGTSDVSTADIQYVPLAFGFNAAADLTRVNAYTVRTDVNSISGFNEPNATTQGNIPDPATAVPAYKKLLRTGYRMGSPATTEEQYNNWLASFITAANADDIRVDYIAIHWYDWGNWGSNGNASPDADDVLNRFKAYINAVYNLYKKPIWITEFNANTNRTTPTQQAFMALALPYLESDSRIERYAWFFENNSPATSVNGGLTTLGQIYSDHVSTASFTANIIDKRSTNIASSDQNLVFNGDFENTTSYISSWTPSSPSDFQKETTNAINNVSIRFASNTNNRNLVSDAITVTPGKTYKLQFTARIQDAAGPSGSPAPTRGGLFTGEILNGSDLAATTFTTLSTISSTNTTLSASYTVPAGQSAIKLRFKKTADIAYLDDVSFVEVTSLPIKLTSFTAKARLGGIDLNWKTASESNNSYFTLQHSSNGKVFSKKATITSLGNSNIEKTYHFLDKNPTNGVNYYQLSQTDFDGKTEIFKPITINYKMEDNHHLKIYSNQEVVMFNLNWDVKELVTVNIFDVSGKKTLSKQVALNNGNNLIRLDVLNILKVDHLYVFNLESSKGVTVTKFIVSPSF